MARHRYRSQCPPGRGDVKGRGRDDARDDRDRESSYVSGTGIEPRGLFVGTYAIDVYVEAGVRDVVADVSALHVSGGLTFRTPLVFAP